MNLESALEGVSRILLDSAPVIYLVEKSPQRIGLLRKLLAFREDENISLVTTPITLAECLIHPQKLGREDLVSAYRAVIVDGPGSHFLSIGADDAVMAGRIRAHYNLSLADAFQVAMAIGGDCQAILTNDRKFGKVLEIRSIILDDLES